MLSGGDGGQGEMGLPTRLYVLNAKAQTVNELYGVLDPTTREWADGLLSNIFRDVNRPLPAGKDERRCVLSGLVCLICWSRLSHLRGLCRPERTRDGAGCLPSAELSS